MVVEPRRPVLDAARKELEDLLIDEARAADELGVCFRRCRARTAPAECMQTLSSVNRLLLSETKRAVQKHAQQEAALVVQMCMRGGGVAARLRRGQQACLARERLKQRLGWIAEEQRVLRTEAREMYVSSVSRLTKRAEGLRRRQAASAYRRSQDYDAGASLKHGASAWDRDAVFAVVRDSQEELVWIERQLEAMERLLIGRTAIVIAHRLSTVRALDRILVFSGGEIVEDGTHDDLLQAGDGHYRRLFERQSRKTPEIME